METFYSEDVEILINGKPLINTSRVVVNSKTKYFLVGKNGCGKTTLINKIYDDLKDRIDILKIDQDIEIETNDQTVLDHLLRSDMTLYEIKKRFDELEMNIEDDTNLQEYQELSEYLHSWDSYCAEAKAVLAGLGFISEDIKTNILSGGWRMRLALGRALLRKPRILILDEPTNHLDYGAVKWLIEYLKTYKKTLIVITHYRTMINELSDVCWFIDNHEMTGAQLYTCNGNYYNIEQMLEDSAKEMTKKYDKYQKALQEKRKRCTRAEVEEFILRNAVPRPPQEYKVNIEFQNIIPFSSPDIVKLNDVSFSYEDNLIFRDLNFTIGMNSRNIIIGNNGVGKTTLFKLIKGSLIPTNGELLCDDRVRISYYNQQIMDNLPLELTPVQYLETLKPGISFGECKAILGKLGLKKNDINDPAITLIGNLSGGQKARVSLSSIQINNPHIILFDEPTNHLDIETIDALIHGINTFNGGILIITHDIHLIESLKNVVIFEMKDRTLTKI